MRKLGTNFFPHSELAIVSFGGAETTTPLSPSVNGCSISVPPNERVLVPVEFAGNLRDSGHNVLIEEYVEPSGDGEADLGAQADDILATATQGAETIVAEAQKQADDILAKANADAATILEKAKKVTAEKTAK